MRNKVALIAVASMLIGGAVEAAERNYLCVGDLSTGFKFSGSKWVATDFTATGDKFAVTVDGLDVEVTRLGQDYPLHYCSLAALDAQQVACGGLGFGFVINFTSLRYQEYYGLGYVDGEDENPDTPSIGIGKCSPF